MKSKIIVTQLTKASLTAAAILLLAPQALFAQAKNWRDIKTTPLNPFSIPQPKKHELPNGMVIFLMEDHELPLIDARALVKTGERFAPAEKTGLGDIFGEVWRTGGTQSTSGDKLDDFLEAHAAKVETWMDESTAGASMSCLKGDFADVFKVFGEILRQPGFASEARKGDIDEKIKIAKTQVTSSIARRNDEPGQIANRETDKLGYGEKSPYARYPEYTTVASITREDLVAWHKKYVHPNRIFLAVHGDFDSAKMLDAITKTFGSWSKGADPKDPAPAFDTQARPGYYLVEKNDINQATVVMVHLGTKRDNPDFYAIEVMNEVFGGGFSARLFQNVRTKKGLAYHVRGNLGAGYDHPGLFHVTLETKSQSTAQGIDALYEEIDGLTKNPPNAEEVQKAKDSILNSFIFKFDSKQKVLQQQMTYAFYGYPADFLAKYRAGIEKVTTEDVLRVAKTYIHRDQIAVVVVGKPADFDRPLDSFGKVTKLDITIPEPQAPARTAATAESAAKGKSLFSKIVASLGGDEKVRKVKGFQFRGTMKVKSPMGEMDAKIVESFSLPDSIRQELTLPMGTMVVVASPGASFMAMGPRSSDMPGSQRDETMKEIRRIPIVVARADGGSKLTINHAGSDKIGDTAVEILDVTNDGADMRWLVDPSNGHVLRASFRSVGDTGPAESVVDYSDWHQVDGMWIPWAEAVKQNGELSQSLQITEYKLDPALDPKMFEKPAEAAPKK